MIRNFLLGFLFCFFGLCLDVPRTFPIIQKDISIPIITTPYTQKKYPATVVLENNNQIKDLSLRVVPDDCLSSLTINDVEYHEKQIPFCDPGRGRILDIPSSLLKVGVNTFVFTIYNTKALGGLRDLSFIDSPWRLFAKAIFFFIGIFLITIALSNELPSGLSKTKHYLLYQYSSILLVGYLIWALAQWVSLYSSQAIPSAIPLVVMFFPFLWILYRPLIQAKNSSKVKTPPWMYSVLSLTIISATVFLSIIAILKHEFLMTDSFDLGIQENLLWNSTHGNTFLSGIMGNIPYFGNHTVFNYTFLIPFYWIFPNTNMLLIAQVCLVVLAVIPLFLWSKQMLRSSSYALIVVMIYILHPAILGASVYDFHELSFVPLCYFSLLLATERRSWMKYPCILLLLCCKEDSSLLLGTLGISFLLFGRLRDGFLFSILGVVAFFTLTQEVIPSFAQGEYSYAHYFAPNLSDADSIRSVFFNLSTQYYASLLKAFNHERFLYLISMTAPALFAPFLSLPTFILASYPVFAALISDKQALYSYGFHYCFNFVAVMIVGYVFILADESRFSKKTVRYFLTFSAFVTIFIFILKGPIAPFDEFQTGFLKIKSWQFIEAQNLEKEEVTSFAALAPENAFIATEESYVPHLAKRKSIITYWRHADDLSLLSDYYLVSNISTFDNVTKNLLASDNPPITLELIQRGTYVTLYKVNRRGNN